MVKKTSRSLVEKKKKNETSGGFNRSRATLNDSTSFLHLSPSNEREHPKKGGQRARQRVSLFVLFFCLAKEGEGEGNRKENRLISLLFLRLRSDYSR